MIKTYLPYCPDQQLLMDAYAGLSPNRSMLRRAATAKLLLIFIATLSCGGDTTSAPTGDQKATPTKIKHSFPGRNPLRAWRDPRSELKTSKPAGP